MGSSWPFGSLAQISEDISYGYTESATEQKIGPHFLRITDIQGGTVNWSTVPYCKIDPANHIKYKLQEGDIVVARTGNSTGENYIFTGEIDAVYASYLIRFRIDDSKACPLYVWYNMRSPLWWNYISSSKTGSAQAGANANVLSKYSFPLPSLLEQQAIASVLGAFDDKIDSNRRMNETLEAMARAIFKDWFVDFGPTKAKMEGRAPYLAPEIWGLFPDRLDDEGKPEGWDHAPLNHFFTILGGGTPKTTEQEYWGGKIPWFSVVDAPTGGDVYVIQTEKHITQQGLEESSARLVPAGTTIISARGTVGKLAMAAQEMTFNQSCYGLRSVPPVGDVFVYMAAKHMVSTLQQISHGAVFSTITRQTFEAISLPAPSARLLEAFEDAASPLFGQIKANVLQSLSLAQTRDLLLPKLMSGEIRVKDPRHAEGDVL